MRWSRGRQTDEADVLDGAGDALSLLLTAEAILVLLTGTALGMLVAILPGINGANVMVIMLPVTFAMDSYLALAFLMTLMATGGFGGSLTAILVNVPGDSQNAATLLDGYPLSQQGRAGDAIGASATASALGAVFGAIILVLSIPLLRRVILAFGTAEMFALSLSGVALIATVSRGSPLKGMVSGLAGISLAFVGLSQALGGHRFTFGFLPLFGGLPLMPLLIGIFAIPEIYRLLHENRAISKTGAIVSGGVLRGMKSIFKHPVTFMRSAAIGTGVGIIPGVGGTVAPWVAYFVAKERSKNPEDFGKGTIEGVIAPEAANDSKDGGQLMPLLALGIPGGVATAILLSAFQLHRVLPGQALFRDNMALVWVLLFSLLFANFATSGVGLGFSNLLVKVTTLRPTIMGPVVLSLAMLGGFADTRQLSALAFTVIFGFVGIGMDRGGFPRPPLIVGFVLLPVIERNFHQALASHRGSYEFLLRPITLTVLALTGLAVTVPPLLRAVKARRRPPVRTVAAVPDDSATSSPFAVSDAVARGTTAAILTGAGFWALTVAFLWYSRGLGEQARMFPRIVLVPLFVFATLALAGEVRDRMQTRVRASDAAPTMRRDVYVTGWVLLLPALIILIGMINGIAVFVLALQLLFERQRITWQLLLRAILVAGGVAYAIHYLFVDFLVMRLPTGMLT